MPGESASLPGPTSVSPTIAAPSWFTPQRLSDLWRLAVLVLLSLLVGLPLTFLVVGSFSSSQLPTDLSLSTLSLRNYAEVWGDPETWKLFYNTAIYAFGATAF